MTQIQRIITVLVICFLVFAFYKPVRAGKYLSARNEKQIREVLQKQTDAWNAGDLEAFMQTYLKSDELVFVGRTGPKYGWQVTLDNYKKGYPDKETMGLLKFDVLKINTINRKNVLLIGRYHLTRTMGDAEGYFSIILKKIRGKWLIISDHSSTAK